MKKERRTIPISKLSLNTGQIEWLPKNPRQWTQEQIDNMVRSLDEDPDFMEDRPPLVVPHDGRFIVFAGNERTEAEKRRKARTELDCMVYTPETEEDQETIIRRAMKDNGHFGSWDWDTLANEWGDFPLGDWGVPAWDSEEISGENVGGGDNKVASEDDFDEEKDSIEVRCKRGDIWQLGDHRLMCGDSIDLEEVKKLMGGALADMVFTDPPYGNTQLDWDKTPSLPAMFDNIEQSCKNNAAILITGTQPFVTDLINAGRDLFKYDIIWKKTMRTGFFDAKKRPMRIHEVISVFYKSQPTFNPQMTKKEDAVGIGRIRGNSNFMKTNGGFVGKVGKEKAESYFYEETGERYPTDVIEFSNWNGALFGNTDHSVVHPTQKPVDLVGYLVLTYSNEGDLVIDFFGGSGTTLIACEQLGRKCRMMELDPHYCDVIIARWEKMTGKSAELISNIRNGLQS